MGFVEKLKNKEIKLFPIGEKGYRVYGKTFDIKDELKDLGATWNAEKKSFEISPDNFAKLNPNIRDFVFKSVLQDKVNSQKVISEAIANGNIKIYLRDAVYKVYGKTKDIYKDLMNCGFKFEDDKYQITEELFNKEFSEEIREKITSYQRENSEVMTEEME